MTNEQEHPPVSHHIFTYYNGEEWVWGDPLEIEDRVNLLLGGKPKEVTDNTNSDDPEVYVPATDMLVSVVREVFKMVEWNPKTGKGATRQHCLAAVNSYSDWKKSLKKSTEDSLTTPPAMEE